MLDGLIDVNAPSKLSKERREQLNQLATQATITDGRPSFSYSIQDLRSEIYTIQEVFDEISELGSYTWFYPNIDKAFALLLEDGCSLDGKFQTYTELTRLFRIIEKNRNTIDKKRGELEQIIEDLDVLELEANSQKGGRHAR